MQWEEKEILEHLTLVDDVFLTLTHMHLYIRIMWVNHCTLIMSIKKTRLGTVQGLFLISIFVTKLSDSFSQTLRLQEGALFIADLTKIW